MHLLPRMNVMLDLICMGPAELRGASENQNYKKWKIPSRNGTRVHNLEIQSQIL